MTRLETKSTTDMRTVHRFVCTACGRIGTWLEQSERVRANARAHVAFEHTHAEQAGKGALL